MIVDLGFKCQDTWRVDLIKKEKNSHWSLGLGH